MLWSVAVAIDCYTIESNRSAMRRQRPFDASAEIFRMRAQVDAFRDELDLERVRCSPTTASAAPVVSCGPLQCRRLDDVVPASPYLCAPYMFVLAVRRIALCGFVRSCASSILGGSAGCTKSCCADTTPRPNEIRSQDCRCDMQHPTCNVQHPTCNCGTQCDKQDVQLATEQRSAAERDCTALHCMRSSRRERCELLCVSTH
jgi:hypothetical protein